jgi:hypothetical protein
MTFYNSLTKKAEKTVAGYLGGNRMTEKAGEIRTTLMPEQDGSNPVLIKNCKYCHAARSIRAREEGSVHEFRKFLSLRAIKRIKFIISWTDRFSPFSKRADED